MIIGAPGPGQAHVDLVGVGFAAVAAICFGGMLLFTRAVIDRIEPVTVNVGRLVLAVAVLALWPGRSPLALAPAVWAAVVLAAACGPFVSRLCLMYAVRHLSASCVKLITLLSPVLAFGLEAVVLGSLPSGREPAGGALILLGLGAPLLAEARSEPTEA